MAIAIAAERSGAGKTTVTLALLSFLARQNAAVQSFKVGPDYIDPMFHTAVTQRPCRNLDPVLTSPQYVRDCFNRHCYGVDYALVEGVMGLFDGVTIPPHLQSEKQGCESIPDFASTAHIARLLNIPIVLVVDCSKLSGSVAAIVHGYRSFDPRLHFAGVILNRVGSDRHLEMLINALQPLAIPILGVLRRNQEITLPDRHLGLIPTAEHPQLHRFFDQLADIASSSFDWQQLLPLLAVKTSATSSIQTPVTPTQSVRIGIARDRAFNFYYQDNLDLLTQLGAQLIPWSPLNDPSLPHNLHGLYFGGGFPEVFAAQLAENKTACQAVYQAIQTGLPTYVECGGLMYLCQHLTDFDHKTWNLVGAIPAQTSMSSRLTLGYRHAQVLRPNFLLNHQDIVWGHEFHRSKILPLSPQPLFQLTGLSPNCSPYTEGWGNFWLYASYLHLHWGTQTFVPQRFLKSCQTSQLL
ncbi:MAG: cobyrinate a,c-diamide synthase [Jaaginema sp. PMC 1079.18]|nr:cobyrinate a,c-diamide synthase [Jaaginema sp. PMC 1080.18]MEC4852683.1 cobyrinate a,c-diamide synthase [Jaaginema sp. PMC 1079.18]MEC4868743.1 cobyrinate a,c-diamide synthase [Jaaginema sp. PMC 1078.18]